MTFLHDLVLQYVKNRTVKHHGKFDLPFQLTCTLSLLFPKEFHGIQDRRNRVAQVVPEG